MRIIELTPMQEGELENPVAEFLLSREAVYEDEQGTLHLSKSHSFTYHEVLVLLTNETNPE